MTEDQMMKMFLKLSALLLVLLAVSQQARAATSCTSVWPQGTDPVWTKSVTANLALPDGVQINSNVAVGGTMYSTTFTLSSWWLTGIVTSSNCSGRYSLQNSPDSQWTPVLGSDVYPTGIAGVGFRVTFKWTSSTGTIVSVASASSYQTVDVANYNGPLTATVEFVKTGPVAPAPWTFSGSGFGVTITYGNLPPNYLTRFYLYWPAAGSKPSLSQSCKVDDASANQTVSLPKQATGSFHGVGTTGSNVADFTIALKCSGGNVGDSPLVPSIAFADAANASNTSNALSLTPDSTATGVGIQVLHDGVPVTFSSDYSAPFVAGSIIQGTSTYAVKLAAQYVQTGDRVTAGSAKSMATFTVTYP